MQLSLNYFMLTMPASVWNHYNNTSIIIPRTMFQNLALPLIIIYFLKGEVQMWLGVEFMYSIKYFIKIFVFLLF
jgi:hypothetical protein